MARSNQQQAGAQAVARRCSAVRSAVQCRTVSFSHFHYFIARCHYVAIITIMWAADIIDTPKITLLRYFTLRCFNIFFIIASSFTLRVSTLLRKDYYAIEMMQPWWLWADIDITHDITFAIIFAIDADYYMTCEDVFVAMYTLLLMTLRFHIIDGWLSFHRLSDAKWCGHYHYLHLCHAMLRERLRADIFHIFFSCISFIIISMPCHFRRLSPSTCCCYISTFSIISLLIDDIDEMKTATYIL